MRNLIKTYSVLLILVILCINCFTSVFAAATIPEATTDFYVNDFANVFTDEEKTSLMNNAVKLANESDGIQVVISTVKSLEGDTVENYALNMYNKYGIGKDDMGLLILLSTEDRQVRVEVGRAMEGYINDAKAGRFIDKYAISYLKDNKFNEGLISLQNAFIEEITKRVSAEKNPESTSNSSLPSIDFSVIFGILGILVFIGLIIYLVVLIKNKINKRKALISDLNEEISNLKNENCKLIEKNMLDHNESRKTIENLKHNNVSLETTLSKTNSELKNLTDRYNRILKIYPDADDKVNEMIRKEQIEKDKEIAAKVDSNICNVINSAPNKDLVSNLYNLISCYKALTSEQKSYIKSDITKLENLYINSLELKEEYERKLEEERIRKLTEQRKNKASSVTKEILAVISAIGYARAHDLYELNDAKDLYDDLDSETKKFIDTSVISKLNSLICAAKRDKDEEERRRREEAYRSSHSSSSSGFGSGGFGGFGGSSGGGGASRGF